MWKNKKGNKFQKIGKKWFQKGGQSSLIDITGAQPLHSGAYSAYVDDKHLLGFPCLHGKVAKKSFCFS